MNRIILHIDVNNAFLSWTAIYMLKNGSNIDIRTRYAIIGGNEKTRHGVVLAKSNLCKEKNIITGESIHNARLKYKKLEVYPIYYSYYREMSNKMYNYLLKYTDKIERYSIDECFLEYTNLESIFGSPLKAAYTIKEDIKKQFGFTVNVGIGNNKLEAKMASDFSKPDKVHTLYTNEIQNKMWPLPIEDLFMSGKSATKKLKNLGINTIGELTNENKEKITKHLKSHGSLLWEYANGIDNSEIITKRDTTKSISNSMVLPYDYNNYTNILPIIKKLSNDTAKKLNNKKMYTTNVNIWIKYSDFTKISKQIKLDNIINTNEEIYQYAKYLFDKIWDKKTPIRALCVGVSDLTFNKTKQLSIFEKR